jgi:hypothetical protein
MPERQSFEQRFDDVVMRKRVVTRRSLGCRNEL